MTEDAVLAHKAPIVGPRKAAPAHTGDGDDTSRSSCMARGPSLPGCVT